MTETNKTTDNTDNKAETVVTDGNKISGETVDFNDAEDVIEENPFFAKNWMSIAKPTRLQVESDSLRDDYGKFTIEPLEPGFGITIGHSLRRVLLSSIRGSAVFAVQIEFSSLLIPVV